MRVILMALEYLIIKVDQAAYFQDILDNGYVMKIHDPVNAAKWRNMPGEHSHQMHKVMKELSNQKINYELCLMTVDVKKLY